MLALPPYQPLFERLLAFATAPEHAAQLTSARTAFFRATGEVFDEDRSFEARMQAFLDWYVFDRPLAPYGEPPVRAFPRVVGLTGAEAMAFRLLGRTVHGLFAVEALGERVKLLGLPTGARYEVPLDGWLEGVKVGDLFEARLVPWAGRWCFSGAFLFHPPWVRRRLERALRRLRREAPLVGVQDVVWMLARMASRAEHYRNVPVDTMYDFVRPPPMVDAPRLRFDRPRSSSS